MGRKDIIALLSREDYRGLAAMAHLQGAKILRYLTGRLYSADQQIKWRAVRALGAVVAERDALTSRQVEELLRRYFWAMNDESGSVPYGIPEAIGEILAVRQELQGDFLPLFCSMLTQEEMLQTGPIERGIIWGLGRIGKAVMACSPPAVAAIAAAAAGHPDSATREVAVRALGQIDAGRAPALPPADRLDAM